ncbi:MAG TPA: methyltransferase type 11 [Saprospirales bacterium]|nr:methyltransferase type 11 [Saprospirales bacterium]HAY71331.1 methyltransferase type 11 [Saprospirales bacterium]HRQ29203.1 class I SAM-dependent methyltransferase [Saprospiraceae bacterium]
MIPFQLPKANIPEPIDPETQVWAAKKDTDRKQIIDLLLKGDQVLVEDRFQTGLDLLASLKKNVFFNHKNLQFDEERQKRRIFRDASNRLLIPVEKQRIALKNAPEIGWLAKFYPENEVFFLPLPQIQGLNSSWQWYVKGVHFPTLDVEIHPYYGVYFPTRFEHLIIFDKWLKNHRLKKSSALDLGTGCGVLSFMMLNNGYEHVLATDINPNALISVQENAVKQQLEDRISLMQSDLFEGCNDRHDLIVFNPPWIPASKNEVSGGINDAVYYTDHELFTSFFEDAVHFLKPDGELIIIFSNFARINQLTDHHPVENELEKGGRFVLAERQTMKVKAGSQHTKRVDRRLDEEVELWVLKKSDS